MTNIHFDSDHDDVKRRERLYDGDIYVYSPTPGSQRLCELARQMCETAFAPYHPPSAQDHLSVEQYIEILKELKPGFIHHPDCKQFIPQLLADLGCDLTDTYFDVPRLRSACSGDFLKTGLAYAFKPHRDTWYSPPQSQLNWWMPVYPIEAGNTMAFHPNYWHTPVANSSCQFNYQDWNQTGRKQAANQSTTKDTRVQSEALEPLQLEPDIRITCPPGGVVVFSAAQLHSTVPNLTGVTRFSIDFRTVNQCDFQADRGAPNLDNLSTGTTMMDYRRGTDLESFSEEEIQLDANRIPTAIHPTPKRLVDAATKSSSD
ncbi:hypothetical protein [Aporhodopirellula aestuarii]|uniref:Phytanoyl-CoA dioxygenase family protein n=1 Tax=Aporhodopirellula aestuarii TaxID=2950107 RepID=A0ABT0UE02_9BACT|nr:hypothetical protein [Aporhodopirellula aestuarii]MCM2375150.1 hypothetical protein [Aporhodopirellula aestuarii]